jgi:type II secretory pathway component PulF
MSKGKLLVVDDEASLRMLLENELTRSGFLEDAVGKIRAEVEAGKTLGGVISRLNVFPKMAVQMISVGESTGALDKMLEKVADF